MAHPAVKKYRDELEKARHQYFITDTQIVTGRVALTVQPSIDAERLQSLRMEFPGDYNPRECPYVALLIVAVLDAATFLQLLPKIGTALKSGKVFDETIHGWRMRTYPENGEYVLSFEATPG